MDIQVSSNFERLLFEAAGRDAGTVRRQMDGLKQSGSFAIEPAQLARLRADFSAGRATVAEAAATIRTELTATGYLADPHTATAIHVARIEPETATPMVMLATAHPAKFPAAVAQACGIEPQLPSWLG